MAEKTNDHYPGYQSPLQLLSSRLSPLNNCEDQYSRHSPIDKYIAASPREHLSSLDSSLHHLKSVSPEAYRNETPSDSSATIHDTHFLNDRIKGLESEKLSLMVDHNNLIREFNKRMQSHLEEIRNLKEFNQKIEKELSDLKEVCCFLDDDRKKCRKLAKEWQKFGRHTVATLKSEVSSYQDKVRALDEEKLQLMNGNRELRDLCFHLDQQRCLDVSNVENKEMAFKYAICSNCSSLHCVSGGEEHGELANKPVRSLTVTKLESKVHQLEKEKDMLHRLLMYGTQNRKDKKRVSFTFPDDGCDSSSTASEIDLFDFPPSNINLDNLGTAKKPNDMEVHSITPSSPDSKAGKDDIQNYLKERPNSRSLNLYSTISPPPLSPERQLIVANSTDHSNGGKNSLNMEEKQKCENYSNSVHTKETLPSYNESLKSFEKFSVNESTNDADVSRKC